MEKNETLKATRQLSHGPPDVRLYAVCGCAHVEIADD